MNKQINTHGLSNYSSTCLSTLKWLTVKPTDDIVQVIIGLSLTHPVPCLLQTRNVNGQAN